MGWLETRIPPPAVAACLAALAWLAAPAEARAGLPAPYRIGLGVALALLGGAIAAAGSLRFKQAQTTVNPLSPDKATALVTSGIYRYTRNPMYLGMTLVLLGVAVWLWWLPATLAAAAFVAYITRFQIRPEERVLAAKFGPMYERYRQTVRRWL